MWCGRYCLGFEIYMTSAIVDVFAIAMTLVCCKKTVLIRFYVRVSLFAEVGE